MARGAQRPRSGRSALTRRPLSAPLLGLALCLLLPVWPASGGPPTVLGPDDAPPPAAAPTPPSDLEVAPGPSPMGVEAAPALSAEVAPGPSPMGVEAAPALSAEVEPDPPPSGGEAALAVPFEVRLRQAGTRTPLAGAVVVERQTGARAVTNRGGLVRFEAVPPGVAVLEVLLPWGERALVPVEVPEVPQTAVDVYVRVTPDDGDVVIVGRRDDPPVSERTLELKELSASPGSLGDAVRAVQNMPGVSWAPLGLGVLIIRGSYPEDSGYFMDGVPIPLVFHFLGLRTVVNTDFLERLTFMPGGFGVRYGRVLGGVIDLGTRMSHGSHQHGYAQVDTFMSTLYATGPIGQQTGFTLSLRRSYIDKVIAPFIDLIPVNYYIQAPQFWDYQIALDRQVGDRHQLRLMVMGSTDTVAVFGEPPSDTDPDAVQSAIFDYEVGVTQAQLRWNAVLGDKVVSDMTFSVGPQPNRLKVGNASLNDDPFFVSLRHEVRAELSPGVAIKGGLDGLAVSQHIRYANDDGYEDPDEAPIEAWTVSPSPYLEAAVRLGDNLTLVPGLRLDPMFVQGQANLFSADPRLAGRLKLSPVAWAKGAIGRYSSFPNAYELLEGLGTPTLRPEHGLQLSLGYERRLAELVDIDIVGYLNRYDDLVAFNRLDVSQLDLALGAQIPEGELDLYTNEGQGRAYGLELLLRRHLGDRYWGWVAYAIQRSERRLEGDDAWTIFDYDQTHLFTLIGVMDLPKQWSLGGRFRYGTGRPYTPVQGRVYTIDSGTFAPVIGDENSARYPGLMTLDVRAERIFTLDRWQVVAYLSVENATNHKNVESHYYSWDYARQYFITGLPIVPIFGVKGAW